MQRFHLSAILIIKDEARYLPEWIEYHRLMGVEHFFVFDNRSADDIQSVLQKYINYGIVTLVSWPFHPGQVYAYSYGLSVFGHLSEWVALIDVDEFISMPAGQNLPEFLAGLDGVDQLVMSWSMFGSSGHDIAPTGLVIENFVKRAAKPSHIVKSIVRPESVVQAEVHQCRTRSGKTVNERLERVPETWRQADPSNDIVRVNHYFIKSKEEWGAKIRRGDAANNKRTMDDFYNNDYNDVADYSLADRAPEVRARLAQMDDLPEAPFGYAPFSKLSQISTVREWFTLAHAAIKKAAAADETGGLSCDFLMDRATLQGGTVSEGVQDAFRVQVEHLRDEVRGEMVIDFPAGDLLAGATDFGMSAPGRLYATGVVDGANEGLLEFTVTSSTAPETSHTTRLALKGKACAFILALTKGAVDRGKISVASRSPATLRFLTVDAFA